MVARRLLHPRKKTVGVRIPDHVVLQALLTDLGEPVGAGNRVTASDLGFHPPERSGCGRLVEWLCGCCT
jgi:hypothetical protein